MSVVLFIVGALALMAGVAMVGFGIPIKEFSFGNTLIAAGAPVAVGGLVIVGLAAVVSKLRQLNETLNARAPLGSAAPDMFEATIPPRAMPPAGDLSLPRRPRASEPERPLPPRAGEPSGAAPDRPFGDAPMLPNPDLAPESNDIAVEKTPALAPPPRPMAPMAPMAPMPPPPAATAERGAPLRPPPPRGPLGPPPGEPRGQQADRPAWRAPPPPAEPRQERDLSQPSRFDAMWPAGEAKPAKPAFGPDSQAEPERPPRENAPPAEAEPQLLPPGGEELRAVAILKSGVVDGMGYTLYVDGSIEAELPQGTLRFASITELRGYLQKNA